MVDLNKIVQGLSKSGAVSGFAGGLAGTALAGALTGKKGKKVAKSALKVGALAAVGGLAYTAYQRYQQGNSQAAQGAAPAARDAAPSLSHASSQWEGIGRERFESVVAEDSDSAGSLLLVRAMIAAAAADGHMDGEEQARIFGETERLNLTAEEKARLFDELRTPLGLADIARQVSNPETAVEVYAASLIAIDESRPDGQAYLRNLAAALQLPDSLVESVHAEIQLTQQNEAA